MTTQVEPRWLSAEQQRIWRSFLNGVARINDRLDAELARLEALVGASERVRGVGETGLDYFRTTDAEGQAHFAYIPAEYTVLEPGLGADIPVLGPIFFQHNRPPVDTQARDLGRIVLAGVIPSPTGAVDGKAVRAGIDHKVAFNTPNSRARQFIRQSGEVVRGQFRVGLTSEAQTPGQSASHDGVFGQYGSFKNLVRSQKLQGGRRRHYLESGGGSPEFVGLVLGQNSPIGRAYQQV